MSKSAFSTFRRPDLAGLYDNLLDHFGIFLGWPSAGRLSGWKSRDHLDVAGPY